MKSIKSNDALCFWCDPHRSFRTEELEHWLRAGVKQGNLWCVWQLALLLKETKKRGPKMNEAIGLLKRAASRGYAPAEFSYGVSLSFGEGVRQDKKAALFWYRRSAAHGFPPAAYNLGHFLENGIVGAANKGEAARWYRIAANMGDSDAEVSWEIFGRTTCARPKCLNTRNGYCFGIDRLQSTGMRTAFSIWHYVIYMEQE